jgi:putative inorganic carbon (HCO3(-)) transporter
LTAQQTKHPIRGVFFIAGRSSEKAVLECTWKSNVWIYFSTACFPTCGGSVQLFKNATTDLRSEMSSIAKERPLYLTLALSGILIFSSSLPLMLTHTGNHDDQRIFQIAFLLFFICLTLIRMFRTDYFIPLNKGMLNWFLLIFFVLGTVSSIDAYSQRHAFYEESALLILLMSSMCIAKEISQNSAKYLPLTLKVCGFGCLLYAYKVIVVYVSALIVGIQPTVIDFTPGFSNYRFFNHAQTITLPLLTLLFLSDKRGNKMMWLLLTGFWWALLCVTGGRGTFVGLAAGCVVACLLRKKHAHSFLRAILLTGLIGLAIYVVFFVFILDALGFESFRAFSEVAHRSAVSPTSGRLDLWRRAVEMIVAHPWLGSGPSHYAHYAIDVQLGAHPHNWVLQIGSEWGLPALLCLCSAIGLALLGLVRTGKLIAATDAKNHTILVAWIVIAVAILTDGLFSGLIVMPVSQLFIVLYIGCAVGWSLSFTSANAMRPDPASKPKRVIRVIRVISAALLVASALALMNGIWPEIEDLLGPEVVSESEAAPYYGTYRPRLWSAGYF